MQTENEVWKCPICGQSVVLVTGGNPRLPSDYFSKCKLSERLCGIECIAFRQETRARELLAEKEARTVSEKGPLRRGSCS